jgi:hypothetical protein
MRKETKTLSFPLRGVAQRAVTRFQSRPYTAPWAVNVRSVCSLGKRLRGGSRPGLTKVVAHGFGSPIDAIIPLVYIDSDGDRQYDLLVSAGGELSVVQGSSVSSISPNLLDENGVPVLAEDGQEIVFDSTVTPVGLGGGSGYDSVERFGKLFIADSLLLEYNPNTGIISTVIATDGNIPAGLPRLALYRDRLFLAGEDNTWYCSRLGNPYDWSFGSDLGDVGKAVVGQVGDAGHIGGVITAMIPWEDSSMIFATADELWILQGDPATGSLQQITDAAGIISSGAWAVSPDGAIAFLASDGVYFMQAGSAAEPKRFSYDKLPEELVNVDASEKTVRMAYDCEGKGFHLFVTPASGNAQHWWLDAENQAIWPVVVPVGMQPTAMARRQGESVLSDVILGCADGCLRKFSANAITDDGVGIKSHVVIGPVRFATNDVLDGMINEIHGILATGSKNVDWKIITGATSEDVVEKAETNVRNSVFGGKISGVVASGSFRAGRNHVSRCRCRGAWMCIWLSSEGRWAYEALAVTTSQLGRLRYGY